MTLRVVRTEEPRISVEELSDGEIQWADIYLGYDVTLEVTKEEEGWGIWGVRIDDVLYRTHDGQLTPQPLKEGPFAEFLDRTMGLES